MNVLKGKNGTRKPLGLQGVRVSSITQITFPTGHVVPAAAGVRGQVRGHAAGVAAGKRVPVEPREGGVDGGEEVVVVVGVGVDALDGAVEELLVDDGVEDLVDDGVDPEGHRGGDAVHEGEAGEALRAVDDHLEKRVRS